MSPRFAIPVLYPALAAGAALYLTGEDRLKLTVRNAAAGVTVQLTGRLLAAPESEDDDPPRVQAFAQTLVPATDRSSSTILLPLGEGWLLDAEVIVTAGTPLVGQCFAQLSLVRGDAGATLDLVTLAAGYITALQRLATPGGSIAGSLEGGGALRSITGTDPAAGAEISEAVPSGARWQLLAFAADLVTSATAANRVPALVIDDGANVYARISLNQNETASKTWRNAWLSGAAVQADTTNLILVASLPTPLYLGAGHRIKTVTAALDAGDNWSAPQYLVREWIEGA